MEEVIVFGRSTALIGAADAASEGSVGGADLLVRPMLRVAEVLEAVPGMIAVQHSGSGKANQYFLRGFNLDHGTDFTTLVDGVPWNLRSHGHGQGYLDVNGLLPQTIERIDYRKGTYRADIGDFAMAASSFITTIDRLDAPFVDLQAGDYGWARFSAGGSREIG
ncbi:MAG: Plug domain-containing protein, partial [Gammaproteobacteria bacterium]